MDLEVKILAAFSKIQNKLSQALQENVFFFCFFLHTEYKVNTLTHQPTFSSAVTCHVSIYMNAITRDHSADMNSWNETAVMFATTRETADSKRQTTNRKRAVSTQPSKIQSADSRLIYHQVSTTVHSTCGNTKTSQQHFQTHIQPRLRGKRIPGCRSKKAADRSHYSVRADPVRRIWMETLQAACYMLAGVF